MRARSSLRTLVFVAGLSSCASTVFAQGLVVPGPAPTGAPVAPAPAPTTTATAPVAPPPGNAPPPAGAPPPAYVPPPASGPPPAYPPPPGNPPPPGGYTLAPAAPGAVYEPSTPMLSQADSTRSQTERRRFGPHVNIFSPNALFGVGASGQITKLLELMVDVGYLSAASTEQSAAATATAEARLITPMARARFWLFNRHNLIFDAGAGVSFIKLTADGQNRDATETLQYERSGTPGVVTGAIGYGYRAPGPFRVAALLGYQAMFGKMNDSKLDATQSFSAADRAELKADLDAASKDIASLNRAYLHVTLGLLF